MKVSLAVALVCLALATTADASALRDPMRPPGYAAAAGSASTSSSYRLQLQSIQYSARHRVATINGRPMRRGDVIGRWRIADITRGTVVLAAGEQRRTLTLFPNARKRIPVPHPRAGS